MLTVRPQKTAVLRKSAVNPQASAYPFVGADAYIGPAERTVFTEIYGEFATSLRAEVGIGPYDDIRKVHTDSP